MYGTDRIQKVLEVFAKNVEINVRPDLVNSMCIADELDISIAETKQLLTTMNGMGYIKSSIETDYSLITREGLHACTRNSSAPAVCL